MPSHWTPVVAAIIWPTQPPNLGHPMIDPRNNCLGQEPLTTLAQRQRPTPETNYSKQKVLLGQRTKKQVLAGKWEFPGGKIEAGESPETALRRELYEELNIRAKIGPLMKAVTWAYPELNVLILFYEVHQWTGVPEAQVHDQINWFTVPELSTLEFPEANLPVVQELIQHQHQHQH